MSGKIPEDLAGMLFRIANNPRFTPLDLEGVTLKERLADAPVAATNIRDGKASFRMSWVMTDTMKVEVQAAQARAVPSGCTVRLRRPCPPRRTRDANPMTGRRTE